AGRNLEACRCPPQARGYWSANWKCKRSRSRRSDRRSWLLHSMISSHGRPLMRINSSNSFLVVMMLCAAPAAVPQNGSKDDVVMQAMRDELARSMKKLQLENLDRPYFISYSVYDTDSANVSASFGSLNGKFEEQHSRMARVQVRVGDYNFDNRNFFSYSYGGNGVSRYGGTVYLPVDDNYDEIRRQLWLFPASAFKKALGD